jgi:6-phospho-3-hexuloisomerase
MSSKKKIILASKQLLASIQATMEQVDWGKFIELADLLQQGRRTYVTGAGRSGLVARSFGMRLMQAGFEAYIPGETITPAAREHDLLVAISCTGETGYTSYLAGKAKQLGTTLIVMTATRNSSLFRLSDQTIIIPVQAENIVLKATVFEHVTSLCLDALFNLFLEKFQIDSVEFQKRHANLE